MVHPFNVPFKNKEECTTLANSYTLNKSYSIVLTENIHSEEYTAHPLTFLLSKQTFFLAIETPLLLEIRSERNVAQV